uniref:Uncharacterized protein n=1 Tax=Meloidogyne floridensis TaxID=298350 RepID=A0A915NDK6_9BILA
MATRSNNRKQQIINLGDLRTEVKGLVYQLAKEQKSNSIISALKEKMNMFISAWDDKLSELTINSAEEKERKRSLVIIGFEEKEEGKPSEKAASDKAAIVFILDGINVAAEPLAVYRLGKKNDERRKGPRLVKCTKFLFSSHSEVRKNPQKYCRNEDYSLFIPTTFKYAVTEAVTEVGRFLVFTSSIIAIRSSISWTVDALNLSWIM